MIDKYGEGPGSVDPSRDLARGKLQKHTRMYLSANDDFNRESMRLMNQPDKPHEQNMKEYEAFLAENGDGMKIGSGPGKRFKLQNICKVEEVTVTGGNSNGVQKAEL